MSAASIQGRGGSTLLHEDSQLPIPSGTTKVFRGWLKPNWSPLLSMLELSSKGVHRVGIVYVWILNADWVFYTVLMRFSSPKIHQIHNFLTALPVPPSWWGGERGEAARSLTPFPRTPPRSRQTYQPCDNEHIIGIRQHRPPHRLTVRLTNLWSLSHFANLIVHNDDDDNGDHNSNNKTRSILTEHRPPPNASIKESLNDFCRASVLRVLTALQFFPDPNRDPERTLESG